MSAIITQRLPDEERRAIWGYIFLRRKIEAVFRCITKQVVFRRFHHKRLRKRDLRHCSIADNTGVRSGRIMLNHIFGRSIPVVIMGCTVTANHAASRKAQHHNFIANPEICFVSPQQTNSPLHICHRSIAVIWKKPVRKNRGVIPCLMEIPCSIRPLTAGTPGKSTAVSNQDCRSIRISRNKNEIRFALKHGIFSPAGRLIPKGSLFKALHTIVPEL